MNIMIRPYKMSLFKKDTVQEDAAYWEEQDYGVIKNRKRNPEKRTSKGLADRKEELITMLKSNMKRTDIAKHFNVTPPSIQYWIDQLYDGKKRQAIQK